jgi:hypothetical protein
MMRNILLACFSTLILQPTAASSADDLLVASDGVENAGLQLSDRAFTLAPGETLTLPVMADQVFEAEFERADTTQAGGRLWLGRVAGGEDYHRVILTEGGGTVFGMFVTPEGVWTLGPEYAGGPLVFRPDNILTADPDPDDILDVQSPGISAAIRELDVSHGSLLVDEIEHADEAIAEAVEIGSNGTVDVGFVYTSEIAALYGVATLTRLQYLVNLYDTALVDSDTGMRARLAYAGPVPVPWNELTTTSQTLDDLFAGASFGEAGTSEDATGTCLLDGEACVNDGDLSSLFGIRNARAIDTFVFIRRYHRINSGGCGIARIGGEGNLGVLDPAVEHVNGVVVLSDGIDFDGTGTQCADVILAHEIGHNMGLLHNIEWSGGRLGVHDFSYGYQATCQFKTIQSYDSSGSVVCPDNNPPTRANELRLVRYSNPDQSNCQDQACGENLPDGAVADPINGPVSTDSARSLRLAGRNISLFRDPPAPAVRSAVLPFARAVSVGQTATAFATIINPASSGGTATDCQLLMHGALPGEFSFQTTDAATNALTGSANTPADIPAGASQSFVFSFTRNFAFSQADIPIDAQCGNRRSAAAVSGVNTFRFTSTTLNVADVVALAATTGNSGFVDLSGPNQAGAFAVATANVGSLSTVSVSASSTVPVDQAGLTIEICRTNSVSGLCETPRAASFNQFMQAGQTLTFAVFVRADAQVPSDPATNRVVVSFQTPSGISLGATTVAVRSVQ